MATQEEYDNSAGQFVIYEVRCDNPECSSFNFEYGGVQAETIYPYIMCGACGEQILNLKADGEEWKVIQEAFSYFGEMI
jgi:hypothetical protein